MRDGTGTALLAIVALLVTIAIATGLWYGLSQKSMIAAGIAGALVTIVLLALGGGAVVGIVLFANRLNREWARAQDIQTIQILKETHPQLPAPGGRVIDSHTS